MKELVVVCTMGISTAFTVRDMLKSVKAKKLDVNIRALALENLYETIESDSVDLVLLTPPLISRYKEIKEGVGDKAPVVTVDGEHYAKYNGEAILADALKYLV